MKRSTIEKYLDGHAEAEAKTLPDNLGTWKHVVCIPACAESGSLIETLQALSTVEHAGAALVIVVVNARQSASPAVHQSNADTWFKAQAYRGLTSHKAPWVAWVCSLWIGGQKAAACPKSKG
jgi:hypothetical protein